MEAVTTTFHAFAVQLPRHLPNRLGIRDLRLRAQPRDPAVEEVDATQLVKRRAEKYDRPILLPVIAIVALAMKSSLQSTQCADAPQDPVTVGAGRAGQLMATLVGAVALAVRLVCAASGAPPRPMSPNKPAVALRMLVVSMLLPPDCAR